MGDGSAWGMLGQWLAEPENRTVAWIGIGAATMFVLGLIGILTESPRYEQGVDTSGEGAGPGVAVLFVLLVLLGFGYLRPTPQNGQDCALRALYPFDISTVSKIANRLCLSASMHVGCAVSNGYHGTCNISADLFLPF